MERIVVKMKYEKSCGAVVLDGDKVLIIQQNEGHWGFPKGHVEEGETEVQTAVREIKEETNIDVKVDDKYRYVEVYSPKENVEKEVVFFVASKVGGNVVAQEEEVQNIEWLSITNAMERLTYESSKRVLRNVIKDLKLTV